MGKEWKHIHFSDEELQEMVHENEELVLFTDGTYIVLPQYNELETFLKEMDLKGKTILKKDMIYIGSPTTLLDQFLTGDEDADFTLDDLEPWRAGVFGRFRERNESLYYKFQDYQQKCCWNQVREILENTPIPE